MFGRGWRDTAWLLEAWHTVVELVEGELPEERKRKGSKLPRNDFPLEPGSALDETGLDLTLFRTGN